MAAVQSWRVGSFAQHHVNRYNFNQFYSHGYWNHITSPETSDRWAREGKWFTFGIEYYAVSPFRDWHILASISTHSGVNFVIYGEVSLASSAAEREVNTRGANSSAINFWRRKKNTGLCRDNEFSELDTVQRILISVLFQSSVWRIFVVYSQAILWQGNKTEKFKRRLRVFHYFDLEMIIDGKKGNNFSRTDFHVTGKFRIDVPMRRDLGV